MGGACGLAMDSQWTGLPHVWKGATCIAEALEEAGKGICKGINILLMKMPSELDQCLM